MRIVEHGVIHSGKPGTDGAIATFPSVTVLLDASLVAVYRVGPSKDSAGSVTLLRRSMDGVGLGVNLGSLSTTLSAVSRDRYRSFILPRSIAAD